MAPARMGESPQRSSTRCNLDCRSRGLDGEEISSLFVSRRGKIVVERSVAAIDRPRVPQHSAGPGIVLRAPAARLDAYADQRKGNQRCDFFATGNDAGLVPRPGGGAFQSRD